MATAIRTAVAFLFFNFTTPNPICYYYEHMKTSLHTKRAAIYTTLFTVWDFSFSAGLCDGDSL